MFSAPDHESSTTTVDLAPGEERQTPTIRLAPADTFFGLVTDTETGTPIENASVGVLLPTERATDATTDEHGVFQLRLPRHDAVRLRIGAATYAASNVSLPADYQGSKEHPYPISIGHGGRIHVTVWDDGADAACAGCTIFITGVEEPASLVTDAGGNATSDLLAPRTYVLIKEAARATGSIVTVSGGDDTRLARVTPGATVDVTFGEPTRWLTLNLQPRLESGWLLAAQSASRSDIVAPQADGSFRIRRPKQGSLTLAVIQGLTRVRLVDVSEDYGSSSLTLPLPTAGVRGELQSLRGAIRVATTMVVGETSTDEQGRFAIPFLPGGTYSAVLPNGVMRAFSLQNATVLDLGTIKDK